MKCELHHYLSFDGNCAEAFNFYRDALGGTLSTMRYDDSPGEPNEMNKGMEGKLMHARLAGDGFTLMGSDIQSARFEKPAPVMQISVNVHSVAAGEALFAKLSAGGVVFMPMQKTFWAESFGMFADKYGFSWMINFDGDHAI